MKTYVGYARISTEEQSNWSISSQVETISQFVQSERGMLLEMFTDEGFSAKTFNRPAWQELKSFVQSHKVDVILVTAYDRYSRNLVEAITTIEEFERKLNTTIISISQNFGLDRYNPFSDKIRKDFFAFAEFERKMISWRTGTGMYNARSQGRFLGVAPAGYINARDANNKPILLIDPEKSEVVKSIFQQYHHGATRKALLLFAEESGLGRQGNVWLERILKNPLYAGLVKIKAWGGNPDKIVSGIHPAIIDPELYWNVQDQIKNSNRKKETVLREDLPLKGVLLCENGHILTGSYARGRHGGRYLYYHCAKCKKQNHLARRTHEELDQLLDSLSIPQEIYEVLLNAARAEFDTYNASSSKKKQVLTKELAGIEVKIESLESKYLNNEVNAETYQRWQSKFQAEVFNIKSEIKSLTLNQDEFKRFFEDSLVRLTDLKALFKKANLIESQSLLSMIFSGGLRKAKKGFQTPFLHSFFVESPALTDILKIDKPKNLDFDPLCDPEGIRTPI